MTTLADLIGESAPVRALKRDLERIAALTKGARRLPPILIQGETGTGKGLVAQLLHRAGTRSTGPFVSLNCAAIPESLLEAELFGYEPGAFTDAKRRKIGLFEAASKGVLFLDEVGLLTQALQAKLLTTIEDGRVRRLGAMVYEDVDVWVIAATNLDLAEAVREHNFREDLYHRLAVLGLRLPPLRERQPDILLLARHFLSRACTDYGLALRHLLPDAEEKLLNHTWPGNVRELANVIERAILMTNETSIGAAALGLAESAASRTAPSVPALGPRRREQAKRDELLAALEETDWNITHTAVKLRITRKTVRSRLERFGLRPHVLAVAVMPPSPLSVPPPLAGQGPVTLPGSPNALAKPVPAGRLLEWERRRVVLLRATVRPDDVDPPTMANILESIVEKILGFGGRVEGIRHHSVDASFGVAPTDEIALRAVNAALAIQRALGQQSDQRLMAYSCVVAMHTTQLLLARIGGVVQLDEVESSASRSILDTLIAIASSEAIFVTADLAPFLHRHFELAAEGARDGGARQIYRVVRVDTSGIGAWRRLSPFVGRDYEFAILKQRWDQALEGRGQFVAIVGNPGVGKSRLLWEFTRHCAASGRVLTIVGTPIETVSPYLAVGEALRGLLRQPEGKDDQRLPERVTDLMQDLEIAPSLGVPILELLGHPSPEWLRLDLSQRRGQILAAVTGIFRALSTRSPLALFVDDAQWLDRESLDLIGAMVDELATQRILVVVARRPDTYQWAARPHSTDLPLGPISDEATKELLDALVGDDESVGSLKLRIAAWTGGNAFFLEEGVRMLIEGGVLSGDIAAYRLAKRIEKLDVPATVEGVLEGRIDRLSPLDKTVLQSMSVAGTEVEIGVLRRLVSVDKDSLHKSLARLHGGEFIYQSHASPQRIFAFKHALTHEMAYQRVAPDRRRELHAALVTIGEELYAGHTDERADWLAFHALRGEVWDRAVNYLQRAAGRAIARASSRVAAQHLESALAIVDRLPPSDERTKLSIDLRIDLRHAMTPLGRVQRTLDHLCAAEILAIELDDPTRLGRIVSFIANCLILQGRYTEALVTGERAISIARELGDRPLEISTKIYMGRARMSRGEYAPAVELFRGVIRSLDERPLDFLGLPNLPAAVAGGCLALILADQGDFAEAETQAREAARRADASGQPDSIMWAYRGVGTVALVRGDAQEAVRVFDRLLAVCRAHDLDAYVTRTMAALGCAKVRSGQMAEGRGLLEHAVVLDTTAEPRTTYTIAVTALAEAHFLEGDISKAVTQANDAVQRARLYKERVAEAYASWVLAMTQSASGDVDAAEQTYREAASIAKELRLRPLLAHCFLGLGDVWERRGDMARAEEHRTDGQHLIRTLEMRPWIATRREA